jgi:hypothetical protein
MAMCSLPNRSACSDAAVLAWALALRSASYSLALSRKRVGKGTIHEARYRSITFVLVEAVMLGAQTFRGAIDGTVTDPSGAVVPNAQVQTTEIATSVNHNTVTTADGQFSIQDLPLGAYRINVAAPGFATYIANDASVTAGSIYTLAVKLSLGQKSSFLEVRAAAVTVDSTTSTQTDTIPEEAVQDIPLNGRDFTQLIAIAPGYGGYSINGGGTIRRGPQQWRQLAARRHRQQRFLVRYSRH